MECHSWQVWILVFLRLSNPLSIQRKSYKATNFVRLCNRFDGWLLHPAMVTPVSVLWAQKAPTLISRLTAEWIWCVDFPSSYVMSFHVPTMSLCIFRCGMTPWPRQPKTGLMRACGSTGHLTSSGSWVKTSPSGQDGEWPLTPLPLPNICCSSQGWLSLRSHGRCLTAPFFFLLKVFALWPGDCLRNAPVTLQINKSCVFSHDPWGQRRILLVGFDFPFGKTGHLHVFLHFKILLRNNMRLEGIELILIVWLFSWCNQMIQAAFKPWVRHRKHYVHVFYTSSHSQSGTIWLPGQCSSVCSLQRQVSILLCKICLTNKPGHCGNKTNAEALKCGQFVNCECGFRAVYIIFQHLGLFHSFCGLSDHPWNKSNQIHIEKFGGNVTDFKNRGGKPEHVERTHTNNWKLLLPHT